MITETQRGSALPVHSIESLRGIPTNKRLIVLSMPRNKYYNGRVVKHLKGSEIYECKQLFSANYYLQFRSTGLPKDVTIAGQTVEAVVFQFSKIIQK